VKESSTRLVVVDCVETRPDQLENASIGGPARIYWGDRYSSCFTTIVVSQKDRQTDGTINLLAYFGWCWPGLAWLSSNLVVHFWQYLIDTSNQVELMEVLL
jgi:hypothetical protein